MSYPKLISKLYSPKVLWGQNDVTVVIRILLHDVHEYYLRVECDHLLFSTTLNEKNYCICLQLFGTIVAEKTTHVNLGREIKVTLFKAHKWTSWLRLQIENEKNPLITSDPDYLCKDKWFTPLKLEGESFTEYKRRNNITNIMPDVPSTDGEESDDCMMDMSLW